MTARRIGRVTGVLLLVQLAGFIVPFVLLWPLGRGFLTTAVPAAGSIRTAVILLFANGKLTIALSLVAGRVLRGVSDTGPLWLVGLPYDVRPPDGRQRVHPVDAHCQ